MTDKKDAIIATFWVASGRFLDRGLQLMRNMIVARLISPEDFGIASLFAMTLSLLEMISNLSIDTLLIQNPSGDSPHFQKTSQLLMVVRGFIMALFLFSFAGLFAKVFNIYHTSWSFRLLAIIPLIRGFVHQDLTRVKRSLNFKPSLITDILSQFCSVILAWPLAKLVGDYSAVLYLIIIQTSIRTIISHIVSERTYSWGWEPIHARHIISFGWPLLINGILMFLIMQGDRFVIGAADTLFLRETYSKSLLGFYSAAFILSTVAEEAIWSAISPIMLPILSKKQDSLINFIKSYHFFVQLVIFISLPLGIFYILMGKWLLGIVYGKQYMAAEPLIVWLGATQSIRLIRRSSMLAALSKGDSKIPAISNFFRAFSFVLSFIFAAMGKNIVWIAASSLFGELLSLGVSIYLLRNRIDIPVNKFLLSFIFPILSLSISGYLWSTGFLKYSAIYAFFAFGLISIAITYIFINSFKEFRLELRIIMEQVISFQLVNKER